MVDDVMMQNSSDANPPGNGGEKLLDSWKAIAAYLGRDVSTVRRWEKEERLPVRRHHHLSRASVYAYPSELDAWKKRRNPAAEAGGILFRWPVRLPAFAITLLLALVTAGGGLIHPPSSAAQDGGMVARRLLERGVYGTVSPDGRFMTDVDWDTGDLAVLELPSMKLRRLTNKGTWVQSKEYADLSAVSPDGRQIAYAWYNGRHFDLRVIGADGTGMRILYSHPDAEYMLPGAWTPDGKYVAVSLTKGDKANQIVLVSLADGSARVLKTFDWRFPIAGPFTPDGGALIYSFPPKEDSTARDIFLLAADGSREAALVEHPAFDTPLGWSGDHQEFLFLSNRAGAPAVWAVRVREGRPDGAPRLVKSNVGFIRPQGLTRDGSLYYGVGTSLRDAHIAPLDLAGAGLGTPAPIHADRLGTTLWPRWSPDGKSLVYLRFAPPGSRNRLAIVIRSLETGEDRELKPDLDLGQDFAYRPALSPDGRSVLLATLDRRGRQGIYQVDVKSEAVTPVVRAEPGGHVTLPAWSADGGTIFYVRASGRQSAAIVARDAATGVERTVHEAAEPLNVSQFSLSRDGRQVAFLQSDSRTRSSALFVVPADGGTPRELLRVREPEMMVGPAVPGWMPDGRHIIVRKFRDAKPKPEITLWAVPAAGGEPKKLGDAPEGHMLALEVHPDGRRIAFTTGVQKNEIWVLENFLPALGPQRAGNRE
jgi:Tol biopolymer transport system component